MPQIDEVEILELNEYDIQGSTYSILWGHFFSIQKITLQWYINGTPITANNTKYTSKQDDLNVMLTWPLQDPETNGLYTLKIKELNFSDTLNVCKWTTDNNVVLRHAIPNLYKIYWI